MVCTFLAPGFEEVEALAVVDLLRRAKIETKLVSTTDDIYVTSSHNITIKADCLIDDVDYSQEDIVFLPGGIPGTPNLENNKRVTELVLDFYNSGRKIAAICAAPSIFGHLGLLNGKKATSYPDFMSELTGATVMEDAVVIDGNIITSRGMGTAIDLGLALVGIIKGEDFASNLAKTIQKL